MILSPQEIHYVGMNHIGEVLQEMGYEFLGVNSEMGKQPQFVTHKKGESNIFVMVNTTVYPKDPTIIRDDLIAKMMNHAKEQNARLWLAGVGIANEKDLDSPPTKDEDILIRFDGFNELL